MTRSLRHVFAASFVACLLILGGGIYPPTVAHTAHHVQYQAAMHASSLRAWRCMAGQALDTAGHSPSRAWSDCHPSCHASWTTFADCSLAIDASQPLLVLFLIDPVRIALVTFGTPWFGAWLNELMPYIAARRLSENSWIG